MSDIHYPQGASLGKTALGKRVVKAKEVKSHFKSIFWLVASHSYDLTDILRKMAEQLDENVSNMSSHAIVKKLGDKLKGKRYLIVLDDVWATFDWETFKCTLEDIGGSKGTTVLMTSRDKNVLANMDIKCHASNDQYVHKAIMHQLKELNEDDSWCLFEKRLGSDNLASNSEKLHLGKRMVNKCGGIPLAIRELGDKLCNKNVEEWRDIVKNEEWNKEEYGILPSLKLSYIYLPNMALKKCFSYCAVFGEDEEIQKEKLIQLWMGQGFLQPYDNMERVGDEYVNILLNTSLFQEPKLDLLGNVISFKIHDLVLSLVRVVSGECCNLKEKTEVNVSSSTDFRHLSCSFSLTTKLSTAKFCENLRTYYNYCPHFLKQEFASLKLFLKHSKCLRVLSLQRLGLEDLPKSVGDLKHLRYLDISQNCFQSLPVVITKLYHLQVLRIDYNANCQLYCSLRQFEVRFLKNLRHISAKAVDIGILEGMRHLTALQTLSTINLQLGWGGKVIELRELKNLRGTLGIKGLESMITEEEAISLNLGNKLNVDRLFLEWSDKLNANSHHNQILQHLKPHENLSMLDVAHYNGTKFPEWLMKMTIAGGSHRLSKLVSLTLRHCLHAEGELNLENLSSVRFLSLNSCSRLTISLPSNGFRCCSLLESLKLTSCCKIGELGDMSPLIRLQYLEIRDCDRASYELKGLASLPCLKEVITDRLLPQGLGRRSPLCKALQTLYLSTQAAGNRLPIQLQYLVALKELHINDFQSLEILPDWLGKLTSLSSLTLVCLPKLKQMPSPRAIQCLSNLQVLRFWKCPLLEEQINLKHGEWFKIKHIPLSSFESN
ncbi:putative disease resistance protein RGA3 isoform X2 [Amaranthus tricolor]|uniref:putative disease resistance protein RGA3 isoform X2 n=1 Tax=Amaranthus tricolor TaxID=29722 RepID=UPI0025846CF1|nr:putative disease resistance protein RGA3 isoform X2 [Amaranthus tricolor]